MVKGYVIQKTGTYIAMANFRSKSLTFFLLLQYLNLTFSFHILNEQSILLMEVLRYLQKHQVVRETVKFKTKCNFKNHLKGSSLFFYNQYCDWQPIKA